MEEYNTIEKPILKMSYWSKGLQLEVKLPT